MLIFVESQRRPSELIFVVLNFVIAISPGVWHCTSVDVISTCARSHSQSLFNIEPYQVSVETWTNSMR